LEEVSTNQDNKEISFDKKGGSWLNYNDYLKVVTFFSTGLRIIQIPQLGYRFYKTSLHIFNLYSEWFHHKIDKGGKFFSYP